MGCRDVTSQAEMDQAVADGIDCVHVVGDASVVARGSASVVTWGSSRVVAWDSASVEARGSASVVAWGSASVKAWDSARVEARGSSRVEARGSSRVVALGSASVKAWDSARVEARGSSRVEARGSSRVEARGSGRVEAARWVAVQIHHDHTGTVDGGVQIRLPDPWTLTGGEAAEWLGLLWADDHGEKVVAYKSLDDDLASAHGTVYEPGETVSASDWHPSHQCGGGLHVSPSPAGADRYGPGVRWVAVAVAVAGLVGLGDKAKVPSCEVLHECDHDGQPLGGVA